MRNLFVLSSLALVGIIPATQAIDHSNLDEGRPLRMEDPYPIAIGEVAFETGLRYANERHARDRGSLPVEILYGVYSGLQLGIGSEIFTDPRTIDGQEKSGDLHVSALYNFNQETLTLPALGIKGTLNLPTGVLSSGADFKLTGLATKSIGRLSFNFNGGYEFLSGTARGERDGRYEFLLGNSYPLGAPKYTRTTLLWDAFTRQSVMRGDRNIYGAEVGFRHQLTQRTVVDFGVGSEFTGPVKRSPFFATLGLSYGF